ncbi:Uncharacterized protein dnm_016400 [Desulfonema magnum]|uniref:Uncharacterized protein n=1 Tax=Desulfonema magnum TaxID=45655 RepID=A0A975BI87_9BACT|nr:Uncharacterized protein dnm_016400 [Desulfonema magnum]
MNNAGIPGTSVSAADCTEENWENVLGSLLISKACGCA